MSETHRVIEEAHERHEQITHGQNRIVPLTTAIIAVLAALVTLFAHHRSITALVAKNEAILATAKATDQYNYYQARRLRASVYTALVTAELVKNPKLRATLTEKAADDERASLAILAKAQALDQQAYDESERSEGLLHSFETLEVAVTLLDIAIVFASISALSDSRLMLWSGAGIAGVGLAFAVYGLVQAH
jgi:hypothetical protein